MFFVYLLLNSIHQNCSESKVPPLDLKRVTAALLRKRAQREFDGFLARLSVLEKQRSECGAISFSGASKQQDCTKNSFLSLYYEIKAWQNNNLDFLCHNQLKHQAKSSANPFNDDLIPRMRNLAELQGLRREVVLFKVTDSPIGSPCATIERLLMLPRIKSVNGQQGLDDIDAQSSPYLCRTPNMHESQASFAQRKPSNGSFGELLPE